MASNILLIGGAGFIGSHVARQLLAEGKQPVIFDSFSQYVPNLSQPAATNQALTERFRGIAERITVVRGNAHNYREVSQAMLTHLPESVAYLGGVPLANLSNVHVEEALEGLGAVGVVIQAMRDAKVSGRFVYTSSSTVYGDFQTDPVDEAHPTNARGVYAGVKVAGEHITRSFCRHFGIPHVILRPQGVYGPTDINRRVVQNFIESGLRNETVVIKDPTTRIDFTYVEDTAQGFVKALTVQDVVDETFNISTGAGRSLEELFQIVKRHFPGLEARIDKADDALPRRGSLDIAKAKKQLGYQPRYTLETGVQAYVDYYRSNAHDRQ